MPCPFLQMILQTIGTFEAPITLATHILLVVAVVGLDMVPQTRVTTQDLGAPLDRAILLFGWGGGVQELLKPLRGNVGALGMCWSN